MIGGMESCRCRGFREMCRKMQKGIKRCIRGTTVYTGRRICKEMRAHSGVRKGRERGVEGAHCACRMSGAHSQALTLSRCHETRRALRKNSNQSHTEAPSRAKLDARNVRPLLRRSRRRPGSCRYVVYAVLCVVMCCYRLFACLFVCLLACLLACCGLALADVRDGVGELRDLVAELRRRGGELVHLRGELVGLGGLLLARRLGPRGAPPAPARSGWAKGRVCKGRGWTL